MSSATASAPEGRPSAEQTRADGASSDGDKSGETTPDELVGATIAEKFRVEAIIGEGAMGKVYRATHLTLDRPIAIKVLHTHLSGDERVAKRFHREARAASRLSHPNSLHIIDFGTSREGTLYIAMELLDGEDLQTVLDHDAPLSPERIAGILVPVLRALEEAHRAGIVHRDLKPENVVVLSDRSGREHVKVCDFGIAKILDVEGGASITVDGFVCGTPQYMSPEQARGEEIDHRSDIYAAGCVLHQMLVGKVPYNADSALGVITKHLTQPVPQPRTLRPDLGIPASLEAICVRAMAKDPAERFQAASDMADALEAAVGALGEKKDARLGTGPFAHDKPTPAEQPRSASEELPVVPAAGVSPLAIGLGVAALVLAGAAIVWASWGGSESASTEPPTAGPAPFVAPEPAEAPELPAARVEAPVVEEPAAAPETERPALETPPESAIAPTRRPRRGASGASETPAEATPPPEPPPAESARSPGELAFEEGRRLFLANDVPGAIRMFEEAARLSPRSAEVQKQLGRAYMRQGDVARAVAAYRRYLAIRPDAPDRAIVERIIQQQE